MLSFFKRFFGIESVIENVVDYQSRFLNYKNIVEKCDPSEKIVVVKNLLSIIVEYLNFDEAIQTIETIHDAQDNSLIDTIYKTLANRMDVTIDETICEKIHPDDLRSYRNKMIREGGPIKIAISEFPILLNTWNSDRIIRNFKDINDNNIFDGEQYSRNIENHYIYPMDIIVCNGANHSQFAARFQHKGQTVIKAIYNYSNLYKKIYFDGLNYRRKLDDSTIELSYNKKLIFYSGVLFELGRYLLEAEYHTF
ncbi:DUF6710 family protein [Streptococcus mitis]|uniref:DUF6710 family protein n=1 Tax=Streptococcus mitis TaxID=28037 RepID=UPI0021B792F0|nr:DUF6710 family protein [Streptococcus mitis]